jgi:hypothetical protein
MKFILEMIENAKVYSSCGRTTKAIKEDIGTCGSLSDSFDVDRGNKSTYYNDDNLK